MQGVFRFSRDMRFCGRSAKIPNLWKGVGDFDNGRTNDDYLHGAIHAASGQPAHTCRFANIGDRRNISVCTQVIEEPAANVGIPVAALRRDRGPAATVSSGEACRMVPIHGKNGTGVGKWDAIKLSPLTHIEIPSRTNLIPLVNRNTICSPVDVSIVRTGYSMTRLPMNWG